MASRFFPRNERLLHLAGGLLLGVFFVYLGWLDISKRDELWQQQLSSQATSQRLAVEQSRQALRRQALMAARGLVEDPDNLRLVRRIALLAQRDGMQSEGVDALRGQLMADLSSAWQALQEAGVAQLQVHLRLPSGPVSLLRMHQPDVWGDELGENRPMVAQVQRSGNALSGMETSRYGSGMRGIVPIRASAADNSPVVGSLEVAFGALPALQQLDAELQSGLALLVNPALLNEPLGQAPEPIPVTTQGSKWWLAKYSRPEIRVWLESDNIPELTLSELTQTVDIGQQHFLMTRIPVKDFSDRVTRDPVAMILVWRDVTAQWQMHESETQQAAITWLLAFLAALTILSVLMLASRASVRHREKTHQLRLMEEIHKHEYNRQLLSIISHAQSAYIKADQLNKSFDQLLERIIALTDSQFGFVGQVVYDKQSKPYLQTYAISDITWDRTSTEFYQQRLEQGMVFSNLDTLFGQVLQQGKAYISNDPVNDPKRGGLPPGHPDLQSFIGLPILFGRDLVGMIGLANRTQGYTQDDVEFLAPLLGTLGQLVHALRKDSEQRSISRRMEQQRQALRALNEIAALPHLDTISRLKQALELGCAYLQMDTGIISHISDDDYLVMAQHSPGDQLQEGQRFDLGSTYCALTLQQDDVLPIEFMGDSRFKGHPCYQHFALESYLGVILIVSGQRYGTLNFSASTPRETPFEEADLDFIRLLSRWVSGSLGRWVMEQERNQLLERFNKLAQQLPGVVYQYQLSADGRAWFPYSSQGLRDIYGVSPAQARTSAAAVHEAIHPDDRPSVMTSIQVSAANLSLWRDEYRVQHPRMGELWLSAKAAPERLENGDVIWHGFITDITARKQMELTLEHERTRLAGIIQATNVGTWEWNVETGETLINDRWAAIIGYRQEELKPFHSEHWRALFHPEDMAISRALFARHLAGDLDYYECNSRMRHKNGNWVWVNSRGQLISRDEQGNPLWVSGTHTDITTQVEMTTALQKSETRFRTMVSNLPGAVYRCSNDEAWTMSYLSEEIFHITGYPASDFIESNVRSYASIVHPEDLHLTYKAVEHVIQQQMFELNYRVLHADGHDVWVKEKGRGEYDSDGNLLWLSGFIWDATEQHRIDQMKNQFVSTVSHELRTPLTAISGSLGLISGGALGPIPPAMAGLLDMAHTNSQRLNHLINDLLDMDKLAAGKMKLHMLEQPLAPILQQALEANQSYAQQYEVQLIAGQIDAVSIVIDAQRLGQILSNFLSNAAKFSYPGSNVTLSAIKQGTQVKISVTDTGQGIPEAFHHTLFEKFSQVDSTSTRKHEGTGLGLAISRDLTERMGGKIGFVSKPDKGSTFWCQFNLAQGEV